MKKLFLISIISLCAFAGKAQEVILDFSSTVDVRLDRSVDVTEVITVRAEGQNIQRGIFRDIITVMVNERGRKQFLTLQVYEVLKDGVPEPFITEGINNVTRIRIGQADVILSPAEYTYTIKYNLDRQVRFFDIYDEVYWNATGNDWQFTIEKASVTINLPEGASVSQHAGYTGPMGATGCDCSFSTDEPNTLTYAVDSDLNPYEGLTVAVGWQKGIIAPPTESELEAEAFNDNRGIYYGLFGLLILAAYLLFAWSRVGKDPRGGSVIPRYEPPDGFSAAACRYVMQMGFDKKAFTASIVSMALKGYLVIDKSEKHYVLRKISKDKDNLSAGEKRIAGTLFSGTDTITLGGSYISSLNKAVTSLEEQLKSDFYKINFRHNYGWMVPAILLGIVIVVFVMSTVMHDEVVFFSLAISIFVLIFLMAIMAAGIASFKRSSGFPKIMALFPALFIPAFIVGMPVYTLSSLGVLTMDEIQAVGPYLLIFLGIIGMIVLFFNLIKAPTVFGRKRMDEIEGLKMFMEVAEKDRLNLLNPPEKTPQFFEKLLPYAIALNVENRWSKQFDEIIDRAMKNNEYRPTWYIGDPASMFRVHTISASLSSSLSSAVSTSSTPPSSSGSSGSSGGGSSGGGGGGGGGGGW